MTALLAMAFAAAAGMCTWPRRPGRRLAAIAADTVAGRSFELAGIPGAGRQPSDLRAPIDVGAVPIALDLIAVCLTAGAHPAAALAVVGSALPGRLGGDLATVARALALGSCAHEAWALVLVGPAPPLGRAAARFVHAERSGAALAPALAALAADQRRVVALERARAARRVGVLAAAPLGLCFLPAFILTGVLPVIAGLVARLQLS